MLDHDKMNKMMSDILKTVKVYPVNNAVILDHVNYFGLVEGKQIMFCTHLVRPEMLLLWCRKQKRAKFHLSPEGESYLSKLSEAFHSSPSSYVAEVELFHSKSNQLEMWKKLYEKKLFPYWNPERGPFAFFNSLSACRIALCKIYKINLSISKGVRGKGGDTIREITEELKSDILKAIETKILINEKKYEEDKNDILNIINEFE